MRNFGFAMTQLHSKNDFAMGIIAQGKNTFNTFFTFSKFFVAFPEKAYKAPDHIRHINQNNVQKDP